MTHLPNHTARGTAMALAAVVIEALTGKQQELYWCVDSMRHFGTDTVTPERPAAWLEVLRRAKDALDRMPPTPASAHLGMALRTRAGRAHPNGCQHCWQVWTDDPCPHCAPLVQITFRLPYAGDAVVLCGAPPSVGVWRLWPDPDPVHNRDSPRWEVPASFFLDGIPF